MNNQIIIGDYLRLCNVHIIVKGSNNTISIGDRCYLNSVTICIEDDNNNISIGCHTSVSGNTELAAIEGTTISIGEDCMFSANIKFRTGDSHSILDERGNRINPSKDIFIGNHVWIGNGATILKGSKISDNSIVAHSAVVCSKFSEDGIVVAGIPATTIKQSVNWSRERIKINNSDESQVKE